MKLINKIFFRGLILVLPISLTFYLLYWVSIKVDGIFSGLIKFFMGHELYIPGAGIILTLVFVFLIGLLAHNYITAKFVRLFTAQLEKFPLIKSIYNPLKDLMSLLPGRGDQIGGQKVVLVEMGPGVNIMGLVTRDELGELPGLNLVSVYFPFSYMLGGVTLLVEASKVKKVDMPVEQALKLSVTGWIKAKADENGN